MLKNFLWLVMHIPKIEIWVGTRMYQDVNSGVKDKGKTYQCCLRSEKLYSVAKLVEYTPLDVWLHIIVVFASVVELVTDCDIFLFSSYLTNHWTESHNPGTVRRPHSRAISDDLSGWGFSLRSSEIALECGLRMVPGLWDSVQWWGRYGQNS